MKKLFIISIFVLLCAFGCSSNDEKDVVDIASEKESKDAEDNTKASKDEDIIKVYVCGAVNRPGVYELKEDSRLNEAIELAGGFTENAHTTYINQAEYATDGQKIYVPTIDEVSSGIDDGSSNSSDKSGLVNINTASDSELKTLTGIGDSRAKDIIAYREANGGFKSIEEIMNVPGIKQGTFDKIKDFITV